jgi:hypothetical protein
MFKRTLSLILTIIIACQPAFAQNQTGGVISSDHWYNIEDFSGGLKSHISTYLTPKNAATVAQNVRFNEKYGALVKRNKMLQLSACRAFPVKSLFRYYKSDATKFTIETSSTFIDYVTDSTGVCVNLATGLSDSKRWNWVTYKDVAIGTNGTDRPKKWDGKLLITDNTDAHRTAGDLITELGAPFAELNTGSNLDASSWYQYKVAFYDGTTYKYSNARSNPLLTGSSVRDIYLTDIPIGPAGTTARTIYRTEGQSSRANVLAQTTYYKVATISDNTTRVYADAITDATIAADAAPTWATVSAGINASPPYAKYEIIHEAGGKEYLFMANDPSGTVSGKSTIYWSDNLNPDYFNTATDYELIRPDDGDGITVLRNDPSAVIIGKDTTWSKFYTESATSSLWTIGAPFSFIGCVAPYSVANSNSGIIYLGRYGLYTLNGGTSQLISDSVTDKIRDILGTNMSEVAGIYHDNQYLMSYTSTTTGASTNDRVLIFDITRNAYAEDTKSIDSWMKLDSGTDFGTLYSGSSTTDGKVYAHSGAFDDLVYRYLSQFNAGTHTATITQGTQDDPTLSLGWDKTWTTVTGAWSAQGSSTWLVQSNSGTWVSPAIQVNANSFDKLYWNEELGAYGDVTFAIKTATTEAGLGAASYSSAFTDPSGSDISGISGNTWIQIKATLTTTSYANTPYVILEDDFVFHMTYSRTGSSGETSVLSLWQSGFTDMGSGENPNRIKEIQVFYEGTAGTLTVTYENDMGQSYSFDINMSVAASASTSDMYFGNSTEKYFVHIPTMSEPRNGRKWRFSITNTGTDAFKVNRVAVRSDIGAYTVPK